MGVRLELVTFLSDSCPECYRVMGIVEKLLETNKDIEFRHVDIIRASSDEIQGLRKKYGVFITPLIVINDTVYSMGRVPSLRELEQKIRRLAEQ